ncbi:MAG TPA: OmpH family outer membrane protein [Tepidisphaeraceae bacterium]|nr:OmpH family outer membrane protein [Tepidisphaeraceae bacterium]
MLRSRSILLTLLAALAALTIAPAARADNAPGSAAQASQVKIGIANLRQIITSLREAKDLDAKRKDEVASLVQQQQQLQQKINDLTNEVAILKPGTTKYDQVNNDLLINKINYDAWSKATQDSIERQEKADLKHIYNEVHDAITQIAQEKGLNVVLADQGVQIPDDLDTVDLPTLDRILSSQTVLYSDGTLDISGDVTTLLDQNYLNQQQNSNKAPTLPMPQN